MDQIITAVLLEGGQMERLFDLDFQLLHAVSKSKSLLCKSRRRLPDHVGEDKREPRLFHAKRQPVASGEEIDEDMFNSVHHNKSLLKHTD